MNKPHDPVLDHPNKRICIENLLKLVFKNFESWEVVEGIENIKWDFKVKLKSGKIYTGELKTRYPTANGRVYPDINVEITQKEHECEKLDELIRRGDDPKDILDACNSWSTGWFFKSKADFILYVTKEHVDIINKKELKRYIYKHAYRLLSIRRHTSINNTSGSYNVAINWFKELGIRLSKEKVQHITAPIYN